MAQISKINAFSYFGQILAIGTLVTIGISLAENYTLSKYKNELVKD